MKNIEAQFDYDKQMAEQRKWIDSVLADAFKTDAQKLEILSRQIMYFAGTHICGANLATTELIIKELNEAAQQNIVTDTCGSLLALMDVIKKYNLPLLKELQPIPPHKGVS